MATDADPALRQLLLDPDYWRPRLERLAHQPRRLVVCPRPDLSRPGIDVLELRLAAHDGEPLRALLGRSAFARNGEHVVLRRVGALEAASFDWRELERGGTDVIFRFPPGRRLEDRVLDVLRVCEAACSLESVDCTHVVFGGDGERGADELVLAGLLREEGWL